jgi:large subunit ribosomal protein L12
MSSPYIHAALLLHSAKQTINEDNLKKVISASGLAVDEARVKALVAAISEVNIDEAIKAAPIGFAPAAPAAAAAPVEAAKPKEEKKKKEVKEEKKEEEAMAGLGALFG